jgi:hypothetical protein
MPKHNTALTGVAIIEVSSERPLLRKSVKFSLNLGKYQNGMVKSFLGGHFPNLLLSV